MRFNLFTIFVVTLIVAWVCFAVFGDYNVYIAYPDRMVIKDRANLFVRALSGLLLALAFAALETLILWIWRKVSEKG